MIGTKMPDTTGPMLFVLSWNRPIYLWVCLDSLFRHTKTPCRVVLADNNSSDPHVDRVIEGFERRRMFHAVHRCRDNDPRRFERLIEMYWDQIGDYFVLIEGDIEILPTGDCWLEKLVGYMDADECLGSIGSRVYQDDFVDEADARRLMPELGQPDLDFLIKSNAPMRRYQSTTETLIAPHNPPLRLLMLRKKVYQQVGFGRDVDIHRRITELGFKSMISTEVVHRHLSLLNIYDYWDYSRAARDRFFARQRD
jgi:GT2 family glycosyltransferase